MLRTIVFVLTLWLIGFILHVAGSLIHIVLALRWLILAVDLLKTQAEYRMKHALSKRRTVLGC